MGMKDLGRSSENQMKQDYAILVTAFVQASSKQDATKKVLANMGHSGVAWDMKDAEPVTRKESEGDTCDCCDAAWCDCGDCIQCGFDPNDPMPKL